MGSCESTCTHYSWHWLDKELCFSLPAILSWGNLTAINSLQKTCLGEKWKAFNSESVNVFELSCVSQIWLLNSLLCSLLLQVLLTAGVLIATRRQCWGLQLLIILAEAWLSYRTPWSHPCASQMFWGQGGCGIPIPGSLQGQVHRALSNLVQWQVSRHMAEGWN